MNTQQSEKNSPSGNVSGVKAPDLLRKAAAHMADRAATYDQPDGERSMGRTVEAFNTITGHCLTEAEGWLLLQLLKDVRQWQRRGAYHADSAEDCIAYAALKAEALAAELPPDVVVAAPLDLFECNSTKSGRVSNLCTRSVPSRISTPRCAGCALQRGHLGPAFLHGAEPTP